MKQQRETQKMDSNENLKHKKSSESGDFLTSQLTQLLQRAQRTFYGVRRTNIIFKEAKLRHGNAIALRR